MKTRLKSDCMRIIDILREGNMLSHPQVNHYVQYALTTGDGSGLMEFLNRFPVILETAKRNINIESHQKALNPFRPYPSPNEAAEHLSGPIRFGYVNEHSDLFGIHPDRLCMPVINLGRVGSGKSQLAKYMLIQMLRRPRDYNIIIPDLKGEYRHLLPYAKRLRVLTPKNLRLNLLAPPEWMPIQEYIVFISKLFSLENWLVGTTENVLIETLQYICRERGVLVGSHDYPTFRDLYNVIVKRMQSQKSFRFRDVLQWLQNRLYPYLHCGIFDARVGIPDKVWRTENIVLELDSGVTDNIYGFLTSWLAGLRYLYSLKHGHTGTRLRTLFVIDEARILFRERDVSTFGESYINEIITKTREFGIGFFISSQETQSINQVLRAIAYTKICFPLTDGADVNFVRDSFGLDFDQAQYLFKLPRYGQAIVRYGGFEKPFLLAVPHLALNRKVSDREVEERMHPLLSNLYPPKPPALKTVREKLDQPEIPAPSAALLHFIGKEPFTKISDMVNAPGFKSPAEVNKALQWLQVNNYVYREAYKVSRKGRRAVFAVPTPKAIDYLGIKKPNHGKGGFAHQLYQHIVRSHLERSGVTARIEGRIGQSRKLIDVMATTPVGRIAAYEVTLHFENLADNIEKDFEAGSDAVHVVVLDDAGHAKATDVLQRQGLLERFSGRIVISPVTEFFA